MSEVLAAVWVAGIPRTKGSLDQFHQDTPASKRWRKLVATEVARDAAGRNTIGVGASGVSYAGPVAVRCVFVRADGVGDVDKLERCVLDALTDSRVIADDVQVVKLHSDRVERAGPRRGEGAMIVVAAFDPIERESTLAAEIDSWVPR